MVNKIKMGDIKSVKKTNNVSSNLTVQDIKQKPILKETTKDYAHYESIPNELKKGSRIKRKLIILAIILLIIWVGFYFFSSINITIIPKKDIQKLNKEVTLNSWTKPLKVSVMSISEEVLVENSDQLSVSKIKLDEKVRNRLIYDMPTGYKMIGNCKSGILYTEPVFDSSKNPKYLKADTSVLIFDSGSLEKFILSNLYLENKHLKNIDNLSCELLSDIKINGIKSNQVSFILKGDMVLMPNIDIDEIKNNLTFKTQKNVRNQLNSNGNIQEVILKTNPWPIWPVLPKNINNINITINEDFI